MSLDNRPCRPDTNGTFADKDFLDDPLLCGLDYLQVGLGHKLSVGHRYNIKPTERRPEQ